MKVSIEHLMVLCVFNVICLLYYYRTEYWKHGILFSLNFTYGEVHPKTNNTQHRLQDILPRANVTQDLIDREKKLLWSNVMEDLKGKEIFVSGKNFKLLKSDYQDILFQFLEQYREVNLMKYVQQKEHMQLPYPLVKKPFCANVCSAGGLLNRNLGPFIDRHDLIFRFNWAPVKGYEKDVGSRTDVRLINNVVAYNLHGSSFWNDLYSGEALIMHHCCADNKDQPRGECIHGSTTHHEFARQSFLKKDLPYYALDCDMFWDASIMMRNLTDLPLPRKPVSTGFLGFLLASSVCEVIDLFGCIDQDSNKTHYFLNDNDPYFFNPMRYGVHPWLIEKLVYLAQNILDEDLTYGHGIIRIILKNNSIIQRST